MRAFRALTGGGKHAGHAQQHHEQPQQPQQPPRGAVGAAAGGEEAAGARAAAGSGGSSSGYNSNESTIKIADPAALSRSPPAVSADSGGPSETTRKRAEATKQYLETLYQQRKSRDKAKQERRDSLEKQLKMEKKTNMEIEERLKALDVRVPPPRARPVPSKTEGCERGG